VDGQKVKVVLVEGKVRVAPIHREGLDKLFPQLVEENLAAGQQLVAHQGVEAMLVATADVQSATSWKSGRLIFRDDTLAAAVAELNRYSNRLILVTDPKVATLKVSGVFSADQPENFLAAITELYPLNVVSSAPGTVELTWRSSD